MARFASLDRQVERIQASLHRDKHVASTGTARNYAQALKTYGEWLGENGFRLENSTYELACQYLDLRSEQVGQKSLDRDRQAINAYHKAYTAIEQPLPILKSEEIAATTSRRYTEDQMLEVCRHQSPPMAFATQLAYHSGLRAHELLTLEKGDHSDPRNWEKLRWSGAYGHRYTVTGKGGLKRTVVIPYELAEKLEREFKLAEPRAVVDRGINYVQRYDLKGGNAVSSSFTKASKRALGWSRGFHGLRHSFAQNRYATLLARTQSADIALRGTSHALGHLRPEITLVYLR